MPRTERFPPRDEATASEQVSGTFPARRLRILSILFTLTGATALLVEQAFEKLLSTLLGASTPAAATVLGVYFGGLTLGGLLYGRLRTIRRGGALAAYSLFEGTVALALQASFPPPEIEPAVSDALAWLGGSIEREDYLNTIGVPGVRPFSRPIAARP